MLAGQNPTPASASGQVGQHQQQQQQAQGTQQAQAPPRPAAATVAEAAAAAAQQPILALQDEKRTSLLDVLREKLQRQGKSSILYRVVVCGEVNEDAKREDHAAYYQRFFKQLQSETDLITGLLLVMPGAWVHILEASHKVTLAFLRDLAGVRPAEKASAPGAQPGGGGGGGGEGGGGGGFRQTGGGAESASGFVRTPRVLVVDDDVGHRFYPFWSSRVLARRPGDGEYDPARSSLAADEAARTVTGACVGMMMLGTMLSGLQKNDLKAVLEELADRYGDIIPKSDTLQVIANSDLVMSLREWLEVYDFAVSSGALATGAA